MTSTIEPPVADLESADSGAQVLAYARAQKRAAQRAEANVLAAAVAWADHHPVESIVDAASWEGGDCGIPIAGPGAPLVAEFCIAEFAAALGLSTVSGKHLLGHAVEIRHRLPHTHQRVCAGDLPVWRARRVAEQTIALCPEAAASVDAQVAAVAHKVGLATLERLATEAIARFEPERARQEAEAAADGRHVKVHHSRLSFAGTTYVEGELDLADALDLEDALQAGAEWLAARGSTEPLDVRRSQAMGALARGELFSGAAPAPGQDEERSARSRRGVVLYLHLSDAAVRDVHCEALDRPLHLARVENADLVVTADQVRGWIREWTANQDADVVVKPVIDLADHLHVEAYEVPDRLSQRTELRDLTCAFPWCHRSARKCDKDHAVPHNKGGPTCSCNIAPLCRRHHRLKTHSPWGYTVIEPGTYLWTSPHGYQFLRDHTGTSGASRS